MISKNDLVLEAAFGQAQGYIDQYFAKASYKFDVAGAPLSTSYQFYGTRDKVSNGGVNDIYDGTAWLQALTFGYKVADVLDLRLEGTWVKADGQQGYFLQRMTPTYALPTVGSISGGITAPTLTPTAKKRSSSARCMT
ncbi:N-acetylglucosamine-regulated outer membrane porin [Klebsiella variicola]|uniref:N-acetylglucosamine-regulated outer membrane porin n=1 Tax=Klebsiella variicola TaxID=244366 RepID=A0A7H4MFT5_KLEVA|nr:N-acetylglucosamine-regulated outer membrane porin [Klebsiella variicola]